MKLENLQKKIIALGGIALIKEIPNHPGNYDLVGELNGYDIEAVQSIYSEPGFYTVRPVSKRNYYDIGSDYNPSGYTFYHKIKDLEYLIK